MKENMKKKLESNRCQHKLTKLFYLSKFLNTPNKPL